MSRVQTPDGAMAHALTIDWEDWYQGLEFAPDRWAAFEDRLASNTRALLDLLAAADTRATFFLIGRSVDRHPDLVAAISSLGHELAVHGYNHEFVYRQTPADFRAEIRRTRESIERVAGVRPIGFRAPYFSITRASTWALDILEEEDFVYDSSVFPVVNYRYGIPGAPRWPHRAPTKRRRLIEVPLTTWRVGGVNVPLGGAYFRLLPYAVTRAGILAAQKSGRPAAFYIHPWELDPGQPRLRLPARIALTHYANLDATAGRLKRLLSEFRFAPIRDLLPSMRIDETADAGAYAGAPRARGDRNRYASL